MYCAVILRTMHFWGQKRWAFVGQGGWVFDHSIRGMSSPESLPTELVAIMAFQGYVETSFHETWIKTSQMVWDVETPIEESTPTWMWS